MVYIHKKKNNKEVSKNGPKIEKEEIPPGDWIKSLLCLHTFIILKSQSNSLLLLPKYAVEQVSGILSYFSGSYYSSKSIHNKLWFGGSLYLDRILCWSVLFSWVFIITHSAMFSVHSKTNIAPLLAMEIMHFQKDLPFVY